MKKETQMFEEKEEIKKSNYGRQEITYKNKV